MEPKTWNAELSPPILAKKGRLFCLAYSELSAESIRSGDTYGTFWRIYPKFHLFLHVAEDSVDNPRCSWSYNDENEIGEAVDLAEMLHPLTMPKTLMERYRL